MGRPLTPHGGNDVVMTPRLLAAAIVGHYSPKGRLLDPCRGEGAFFDAFPEDAIRRDWCEISQGRDFLQWSGQWGIGVPDQALHYDWALTNPPWSQFRAFLIRAMQVADNVVFLVTVNHFWTKARLRDMAEAGFSMREILLVDTPPPPWPQSGFQCAAIHIQRGYTGPVTISRLPSLP